MNLVRAENERNWHEIGRDLPVSKLVRDLIRFENEATTIYNYEPLLLPGLAQTADYARALMVAARINRQRVLDRADPPQLNLIIEEMVLHRTMASPEMMYGQLPHLQATAARRSVSLRVLPFHTEAAVATQGSLIILECPDQPILCFEEAAQRRPSARMRS